MKLESIAYTPSVPPIIPLDQLKPNLELKNTLDSLLGVAKEGLLESQDRRKKVNTELTPSRHKTFPFSAIVSLDVIFHDSQLMWGTGFMIGSRYILTAAHVVRRLKSPAKAIFASPGRNRDDFPFGIHKVTHAYVLDDNNPEEDIAVLAIEEEIGNYTGWFGMIDLDENYLENLKENPLDRFFEPRCINVTGFTPLTIQKHDNIAIPPYLVTHFGDIVLGNSKNTIAYGIDTEAGQSGSPVWIREGTHFFALAVHNHYKPLQKRNFGVKLTKDMIELILSWISGSFVGKELLKEELIHSMLNEKNEKQIKIEKIQSNEIANNLIQNQKEIQPQQNKEPEEQKQENILIPELKLDPKIFNQPLGNFEIFLNYMLDRTKNASHLYNRLKELSLTANPNQFQDITNSVIESLKKLAELKKATNSLRIDTDNILDYSVQSEGIIVEIQHKKRNLKEFLQFLLKVYTLETFIPYMLNEVLLNENWEHINLISPYIICLMHAFHVGEKKIIEKPNLTILKEVFASPYENKFVYKGSSFTKKQIDSLEYQQTFSWNSITSTSEEIEIAMKFMRKSVLRSIKEKNRKIGTLFKIFIENSSRKGILNIAYVSHSPEEKEILLAPGTTFKLLSVETEQNKFNELYYILSLKVMSFMNESKPKPSKSSKSFKFPKFSLFTKTQDLTSRQSEPEQEQQYNDDD